MTRIRVEDQKFEPKEQVETPQEFEQRNVAYEHFEELKKDVLRAYEEGVSIPEAERLAAKFLHAQMDVADQISTLDLSARMKKNGYKTMRAQVYLDIVQGAEKKPTEAQIEAQICTNTLVASSQNAHDFAEVGCAALERYFDIFKDAHIYFRGIAKGRLE